MRALILTLFFANTAFASDCSDTNEKFMCAQEYAYKCGFDIWKTIELENNYAFENLLEYLMANTTHKIWNVDDCETAIDIIESMGPAAERERYVNIFMSYLNIHTMD